MDAVEIIAYTFLFDSIVMIVCFIVLGRAFIKLAKTPSKTPPQSGMPGMGMPGPGQQRQDRNLKF